MGSSKKVTVGYRYHLGLHMGLCHEPDALLDITVGDRSAWSGNVTESATITINSPNLFGGDEREGGIAGTCDVMMGRPDQLPNAYLAEQQGTPQPAYRGFLGLVYRGLIASNNPYIKNWAVRVRNILRGWHGDDCWYPEAAPIEMGEGTEPVGIDPESEGWRYLVTTNADPSDYSGRDFDDSGWNSGASPFASSLNHPYAEDGGYPNKIGTLWPLNRTIWTRKVFTIASPSRVTIEIFVDNFATVWVNGTLVLPRVGSSSHPGVGAFLHRFVVPPGILNGGDNLIALKAEDYGSYTYAAFRVTGVASGWAAMNPAHIIYQALTDPDWGMGYPADAIDDASFRAAADALFAEGLGLCLKWNSQTTIQEFTQIIADHASLVYGQDRRTGRFRMRLLRSDYREEDLPVFTSRDVKVVRYQRPSLADTVNEVVIEFEDALAGREATTAPLQNLANIQGQGRVVSQTLSFPGIPTHDLAVRVGMRELRARSTPLWRFSLEAKRRMANLLPGEPFVLDLSDTAIGVRLVVRAGSMDYGETADAVVRAEVVEDVFAMPATTYVDSPGGGLQPPSTAPQLGPSAAFEVPYTELVQVMGAAELAALQSDAGFVGAVATRPAGVPLNYALFTRLGAADFDDVAAGDYAPGGVLAEPVAAEPGPTVLALASRTRLDQLAIGSGAFLGTGDGAETVRIDAVDMVAGLVTVGRGAGDTVPHAWPAGTRLWGFDVEAAADPQPYIAGETVDAKVVNRTSSGQLELGQVPTHPVTLRSRQARPYPPGWVTVNGEAVPPPTVVGAIALAWTHRDRVLQADTLVASDEPSVGPEPGTTYTVRWILNGALDHTDTGLVDAEAAWTPTSGGVLRIEVESERDGLASWQAQVHEFAVGSPLLSEVGELFTAEDGAPILME